MLHSSGVLRFILLVMLVAAPLHAQRIRLSASAGETRISLSADSLPRQFLKGKAQLARSIAWQNAGAGIQWSEIGLHAGVLAIPLRAVLVRMDPALLDLGLIIQTQQNRMTGTWNVDSVPDDVVLAFNAGQFKETGPWGWLVINGYEQRAPGFGPLSAGIAIDSVGAVHWLLPAAITRSRFDPRIRSAFQSYPLLLFERAVPRMLVTSDDVNREHRDARLILSQLDDGSLLLVLTRYDGLGDVTQRVPIGLTVPESVALIGALGARNAVMLDGGISAQLLLRGGNNETHKWNGLRNVPLALLARPKSR